jgi:formate dehydrogenase major subunit
MMLYYIIKDDLWTRRSSIIAPRASPDSGEAILKLDIDQLEKITGVDKALVRAATRLYATSGASMEFHGLGVTEHSQGTFTVQLIADLAMITGNIGRPGVGVNPLRGQNNVQGAADMGCQPHQGAGYLDVTLPDVHQLYEDFYGRKLSEAIGMKIPEMFEAAREKKLKALWVMGEDIVQTDPNSNAVKARWRADLSCRKYSRPRRRSTPTSSCRLRRSRKERTFTQFRAPIQCVMR